MLPTPSKGIYSYCRVTVGWTLVAGRAGTNAASKAAAMRPTAQKHEGRRIRLAEVVARAREKAAREETTHLAYAPPTAVSPTPCQSTMSSTPRGEAQPWLLYGDCPRGDVQKTQVLKGREKS